MQVWEKAAIWSSPSNRKNGTQDRADDFYLQSKRVAQSSKILDSVYLKKPTKQKFGF